MISTIVVFAAGLGTRMGGLTKTRPKPLILVQGKPFLYYLLSNIKQAGFSRVILVTGYLAGQIDEFVRQYQSEFPLIETVNQWQVFGQDKQGSLLPLLTAKSLLGDDDFVVVMGDNLYAAVDLEVCRQFTDKYCYLGGLEVDNPSHYGTLVCDEDNYLRRIEEKSENPSSNLINSGLYKFTSDIFAAAKEVGKSVRGEYEITDAISKLAEKKLVKVYRLRGEWLDFGRPEDVVKVEKFLKLKNNLFR